MSSAMYRRQHDAKVKSEVAAKKSAAALRGKESDKRAKAAKEDVAAAKASTDGSRRTHLNAAKRAMDEANKAGKDAAALEVKAAKYGQEAAGLLQKVVKAEQTERAQAELKRQRDDQLRRRREEASRAVERREVDERLAVTEGKADQALRRLAEPKSEKLRVLMLGASPEGDLRVGREQDRIEKAVQAALHRDQIEFRVRRAAAPADLLDGISNFRPHVVHFSGHGDDEVIGFEEDKDEHNEGIVVTADAFAAACAATSTPPILIVLNSCHSASTAEKLVAQFAATAIGMKGSIDDGDAILYATGLYTGIANGHAVFYAHAQGVAAVQLAGGEHELPDLAFATDVDPQLVHLVKTPSN
ncbi:CHAT domain-containing protein [Kribbella sp. NPDC058245]|uniref:CHAT domain-containing protein n=1 Tax=Kribbella sp. NPDC058245 TaxID=3346399 RepID=UPI0036E124AD